MTPEQRDADRKSFKDAVASMNPEQAESALRILRDLADNDCSFGMSRNWVHKKCGDDTGKGFDCSKCRARDLLHALGIQTVDEIRFPRKRA
jgi:hypothetical protein